METNKLEVFPQGGVMTFASPEDAQKAAKLFGEMATEHGLLVSALQEWMYQYPDRHLSIDHEAAVKICTRDIFGTPR